MSLSVVSPSVSVQPGPTDDVLLGSSIPSFASGILTGSGSVGQSSSLIHFLYKTFNPYLNFSKFTHINNMRGLTVAVTQNFNFLPLFCSKIEVSLSLHPSVQRLEQLELKISVSV